MAKKKRGRLRGRRKQDDDSLKVYLDYDEIRSGGELTNPDDHWSDREDGYIEFKPKLISTSRDLVTGHLSEEIPIKDARMLLAHHLAIVVIYYHDGDTFGQTHGYWTIHSITDDYGCALSTVKDIQNKFVNDRAVRDIHGDAPWDGYFAGFEHVAAFQLPVARKLGVPSMWGVK